MSQDQVNDMITDNPDTNSRPSESPSSRPMTLRQQLDERVEALFDLRISSSGSDITICLGGESMTVDYEAFLQLRQSIEALCQGIAREARLDELNDLPEYRAGVYDGQGYVERRKAELTQKPPQPLADMQSDTSPIADSNQVDNLSEAAE